MSEEHVSPCKFFHKHPASQDQSRLIECKMVQKHVLTSTLPLSYHFSHLGVNVFVATCQTPTCFEFSTRVLAPLPHSAGNTDKRAIIVLLFRVPHELLTFWRAWQGSLFCRLTPHFDDKWPTTSSERGQHRVTDSTISPLVQGVQSGQI